MKNPNYTTKTISGPIHKSYTLIKEGFINTAEQNNDIREKCKDLPQENCPVVWASRVSGTEHIIYFGFDSVHYNFQDNDEFSAEEMANETWRELKNVEPA